MPEQLLLKPSLWLITTAEAAFHSSASNWQRINNVEKSLHIVTGR